VDRLHEIFDASYRRLVGQLYGVCGDLTEAEDVVSEAFVGGASCLISTICSPRTSRPPPPVPPTRRIWTRCGRAARAATGGVASLRWARSR
jgi:hypothetical protein